MRFLLLLCLCMPAFGEVIWSSSGYASGQYTVTRSSLYDDDTQESGGCGSHTSWANFDCGGTSTSGDSYVSFGDSLRTDWYEAYHLESQSSFMFTGTLMVPGTGISPVHFSFHQTLLSAVYPTQLSRPVLIVGGLQIPISFFATSEGGGECWTYSQLSGKATTQIERGATVPFVVTYGSEFDAWLWAPPAPSSETTFSIDSISDVPEPSTFVLVSAAMVIAALLHLHPRHNDPSQRSLWCWRRGRCNVD
jgi:hypothetical protein